MDRNMDRNMDKVVERANTYYSFGWNFYGRPDQITPFTLAEAGFICLGGDRVQCHECKGILTNWTKDDIPMQEHRRHFPSCLFIKEWDKKIIQSHEGVKNAMNLAISFDVIHAVIQKDPSLLEKSTSALVEACKKKAMNVENDAEYKRIQQEANIVDEDWKAVLAKYR